MDSSKTRRVEAGTASGDPRALLAQRLEERTARHCGYERQDLRVSTARFVVFLVGLVLAWLSIQSGMFSPAFLVLPGLVFAGLIIWHERVLRAKDRAERARAFYEQALQRLDFDDGEVDSLSGPLGLRFTDSEHPYQNDLDLFGEQSLFQRLCTARTAVGQSTFAQWVLAPAPPSVIAARQGAVDELARLLDLREQLAVLGGELEDRVDAQSLREWAAHEPRPWPLALRLVLPILGLVNVLGLALFFMGRGYTVFLVSVTVSLLIWLMVRGRIEGALRGLDNASRDLEQLSDLLVRLETQSFESPLLVSLQEELQGVGQGETTQAPGRELRSLRRLVDLIESRRNAFFAPIAGLFLLTTQLCDRLDAWRSRNGPRVVRWLEIVGELEALACFGNWLAENPDHVFPEVLGGVVQGDQGARLDGRGLKHPLLSRASCVPNDVQLGEDYAGYVVSGSNMSGKSTYMRATGLTVVLALAGAPVRATSLVLTPLQVGASIRTQDSLQDGVSRFYAEIKRLRAVMELTEQELPVYFLLDEILSGTNSHDRRIGAEAVVRALLERGAIGLVTTHDLALAEMATGEGARLRNVHFDDEIKDGRVVFDYKLEDGVVTRSNALELMREVGLEV